METSELSSRLSNSSSYRREKSFRYPITREKLNIPSFRKASVKEESTNPTPMNLNGHNVYKPCPTDPTLTMLPLPLSSSPSIQSIQLPSLRKQSSQLDPSPCKTEICSKAYIPGLTSSNLSVYSPGSINASPPKYGSFSKIAEHYEQVLMDGQVLSARSAHHGKENSCEISAIVEENSASEHQQVSQPSILFTKNDDENSNFESDSSEISLSHHRIHSASFSASPAEVRDEEFDTDKQARSTLSMRYKETEQQALTFDEAYSIFKNLNLEFFPQNLWIRSWSQVLCCHKSEPLEAENLEICEKLIVFAYLGFNHQDFFHSRLLISIFERFSSLGKGKETWTDVGFSSNSPYEDDLKHDVAPLGLLQLLFIESYMPELLNEFLAYCLESNMALIMIAFDMSEISVIALRKKILNSLMNNSSKPIETIFFLYAGCLNYWFSLHKNNQALPGEINYMVEKLAINNPQVLINLAKEKWNAE